MTQQNSTTHQAKRRNYEGYTLIAYVKSNIPHIPAGAKDPSLPANFPSSPCSRRQAHAWGKEKLAKAATGGIPS
eukprot:1159774-Pelagomonas_calceolata.AAC.5